MDHICSIILPDNMPGNKDISYGGRKLGLPGADTPQLAVAQNDLNAGRDN